MAEPAGWSALPSDLLNRVADRLLATNDVDYYMDLRTVCSPSSRATDDPKNIPDPRFRPSQWIVIDEVIRTTCINFQRHTPLLVNTATGRALREYLPMLRNYYVIATTHGSFFVLADRKPPRAACVLNPFTGYLVRFAAPMVPDMGAPAAALDWYPDSGCFDESRDWYAHKKPGFLGFIYSGVDLGDKIHGLMSSFGVHPNELCYYA